MLLEPAMQHVGIHAVFTRRGGNRCADLLARGDQFSLELRAVDPARAGDRVARIGNLLRHGVHDGLRGHDGACNSSFAVDGLAGRIHLIACAWDWMHLFCSAMCWSISSAAAANASGLRPRRFWAWRVRMSSMCTVSQCQRNEAIGGYANCLVPALRCAMTGSAITSA